MVSNSSHSSILMPSQCDFIIASGIEKDLALSLDPWNLGWAVWTCFGQWKRPRHERSVHWACCTQDPKTTKRESGASLQRRSSVAQSPAHPCQQLQVTATCWKPSSTADCRWMTDPEYAAVPLSLGHTAHPLGREHSSGQFKPLACGCLLCTKS